MTPTTELAEELERACAGYSNGRTSMDVELILQAADTLRKQAEELERCRTALRPFADMSGGFLGNVTDDHVRQARSALGLPEGFSAAELAIRNARPTIFNVGDQ